MLIVNSRIRIPKSEFELTFARSSGPGGQNVNKVSSKAVLRWKVRESPSLAADVRQRFVARYASRLTCEGELVVSSQRFRDQGRNVSDAFEKVRAMVASVAEPPKRRRPTKPTRASVARRIEGKQKKASKKQLRRKVDQGE
jgi:ribosome-associated protein